MAKNLIQRMAAGGPTIQLEQYVPGQYFEKALADTVEYHKFNKELQEEKRQFNEQADLEKERLSIMSDEARSTSRFQQGQLRLEDEKLKREDFREFGSTLPPDAMKAYARANDMPTDIINLANNRSVNWDKFNKDYRTLRANPNATPEDWKTFRADNRNNFASFKSFAPDLEAEVEGYQQGLMNKNLLSTMAVDDQFQKNMSMLGVDTAGWEDLTPEQATYYLKNLPTWIKTGLESRKLSQEDEGKVADTISKAMEYLSAQYQASAEYNPDDAEQIQSAFVKLMQEQFKDVAGLDLGLGEDEGKQKITLSGPEIEAALERESRTGVITTGAGKDIQEEPKVFDADSKYILELTKASGEKITKTVKGSNVPSIQKQKGWEISKADKVIKPLKLGRPQLDSGVSVKDTKTGKTLTYVGYDFAPKEGIVTVGGKKIKPDMITAMAGGMKVLYFKDEDGKSVVYTSRDAEKTTFIEPTAGAQAPEEAPIIAEEAGEETGGGLNLNILEGAQAGAMPDADSLNQAIAGTAKDSIDLFLQEDSLLQELEENE